MPGIYTKLIDVDKVDLILGPYATNMIAPAMPVVMQKGKTIVGLFGLAVNSEFNYPKYFAMIPTGQNTKPSFTEGFFEVAAKNKIQTVALVAADAEFAQQRLRGRARRTPRSTTSRSSTIANIRRRPPTSPRSCARSRRRIRMPW